MTSPLQYQLYGNGKIGADIPSKGSENQLLERQVWFKFMHSSFHLYDSHLDYCHAYSMHWCSFRKEFTRTLHFALGTHVRHSMLRHEYGHSTLHFKPKCTKQKIPKSEMTPVLDPRHLNMGVSNKVIRNQIHRSAMQYNPIAVALNDLVD